MKKYNYKDDFEMLYLRHEYLARCENLNGDYVKEFAGIVNTTARIMYRKLYPNFNKVGLYSDDMVAITNIYMLGYMGVYSLRNNSEAKEKFIGKFKEKKGREPNEEELYKKDRNNMITFLKQRLQHCSVICARKARNIVVGKDKHGVFAETADTIKASEENILKDYKKFRYRKVTQAEFKEIKMVSKENNSKEYFDKDGYSVFKIEILNSGIKKDEYSRLLFTSGSKEFMKNPEEKLISAQDEVRINGYYKDFKGLENNVKRIKINKFIKKNKGKELFKKELALARKWLKDPKLMV